MTNHKFYVGGMHCASCKIFIEETLNNQEAIKNAQVDLKEETVHIDINDGDDPDQLISTLNAKIKPYGYFLSAKTITAKQPTNNTTWAALSIGIIVLILFFLLQKSGILNLGIDGKTTPTTSFIIGLIASASSCLAVVGGLVLSLSAKVAQNHHQTAKKTFALFHLGRIAGFALLGGLLGLVGQAIAINFIISAILGLIASVIMIFLGLSLVGLLKQNGLTLSSDLFKNIRRSVAAPLLVGISTFFLPCGFTQSMQISALSSGSFVAGMQLMLAFALGTLPMLIALSFGSTSFAQSKYSPLFFQSTGVVVIGLGIFTLLNGLAGIGLINPLFNI